MDRLEELVYTQDPGPLTDPLLFYQTVRAMQDERPPTMKELSEASRVPKATMTRIVDHWVRQGYAERVYDPEDRRIIRVTLTDRGRELRDIMLTYAERRVGSVLGPLTDEEQAILVTLLTKISRS
jgi:DNA-binding MarR family transcriptional regulator